MSSAINRAISRNGLGFRSPMLTVGSADVCGGGGSGEEDQKLRTQGVTERGDFTVDFTMDFTSSLEGGTSLGKSRGKS